VAQAVQRDWLRLGVQVTLRAVPYDQLVADYLGTRLYQAALVDLNLTRSPDPDPYPFWHEAQAQSGQNYSGWNDRQASEYLESARVVSDMSERTRFYRNFQVRFNLELPALPLFYPVYTYAVDSEVQGVRMGPLFDPSDRYATVTSWFLLARRAASPVDVSVRDDGGEEAEPTP
jgi:peptide/nickel transport system substrate-binding protein